MCYASYSGNLFCDLIHMEYTELIFGIKLCRSNGECSLIGLGRPLCGDPDGKQFDINNVMFKRVMFLLLWVLQVPKNSSKDLSTPSPAMRNRS